DSDDATHAVKGKQPNLLGLYDMAGNVTEWCRDKLTDDPYPTAPDENNPVVDPYINVTTGNTFIVRGGCCSDEPDKCRSARRNDERDDLANALIGFRLILIP
ncbi:MAG: SUMF1/EgtB/PvdO family nonheme iron enzyme, partial [Rikenellaceae bacterium]